MPDIFIDVEWHPTCMAALPDWLYTVTCNRGRLPCENPFYVYLYVFCRIFDPTVYRKNNYATAEYTLYSGSSFICSNVFLCAGRGEEQTTVRTIAPKKSKKMPCNFSVRSLFFGGTCADESKQHDLCHAVFYGDPCSRYINIGGCDYEENGRISCNYLAEGLNKI